MSKEFQSANRIVNEDDLPPLLLDFDDIHNFVHFDANGNFQFEKTVRLSDNKEEIWVMTQSSPSGDFDFIANRYNIKQQYVVIHFEKDNTTSGYYSLNFKSTGYTKMTDNILVTDVGIELRIVGKTIHFIGADDIRTYAENDITNNYKASIGLVFNEPLVPLDTITKSVLPGGKANIKHSSPTEIHFECNC